MKKIEGVPEGWEIVAYQVPRIGDLILVEDNVIEVQPSSLMLPWLIVKKVEGVK